MAPNSVPSEVVIKSAVLWARNILDIPAEQFPQTDRLVCWKSDFHQFGICYSREFVFPPKAINHPCQTAYCEGVEFQTLFLPLPHPKTKTGGFFVVKPRVSVSSSPTHFVEEVIHSVLPDHCKKLGFPYGEILSDRAEASGLLDYSWELLLIDAAHSAGLMGTKNELVLAS